MGDVYLFQRKYENPYDFKIERIVNGVKNGTLEVSYFNQSGFEKKYHDKLMSIINRENNQILSGGIGKVYFIDNYAIKINYVCQSQNIYVNVYCEDLNNVLSQNPRKFMKIMGGYKYIDNVSVKSNVKRGSGYRHQGVNDYKNVEKVKDRYILPNLYGESIVGMIFERDHTFLNFAHTKGAYIKYKNGNPVFFQIMEKYKPLISSDNKNVNIPNYNFNGYLLMLFQLCHALMNAQKKYRFTHYDLHSGNILYKESGNNTLLYQLQSNDPIHKLYAILPPHSPQYIIADYGMSRIETEKTLITMSQDRYPDANFSEYNSSYDVMSLFGTTIFDSIRKNPFKLYSPYLDKESAFELTKLLIYYFNDVDLIKKYLNLDYISKILSQYDNTFVSNYFIISLYNEIKKDNDKFKFTQKHDIEYDVYNYFKNMDTTLSDFDIFEAKLKYISQSYFKKILTEQVIEYIINIFAYPEYYIKKYLNENGNSFNFNKQLYDLIKKVQEVVKLNSPDIYQIIREKYYTKTNIGKTNFRPKHKSGGNLVNYYNTLPLNNLVTYLHIICLEKGLLKEDVDLMEDNNYKIAKLYLNEEDDNIFSRKISSFREPQIQLSLESVPRLSEKIKLFDDLAELNIYNYNKKINKFQNFNLTLPPSYLSGISNQQIYTEVVISPNYKNKNYSFKSECCKIDPINYMRINNYFGIALNGTFFNIGRFKDYSPIGIYRQNMYGKYNPIPKDYEKDYGNVIIYDDGTITISPLNEYPNIEKGIQYFFQSGPLMIWNGKTRSYYPRTKYTCNTEQNIRNINSKLKTPIKYQKSNDGNIIMYNYIDYQKNSVRNINQPISVYDCNNISPGELKHILNPNPRSALAIRRDGSIILATVEGRGEEGIGMDVIEFSNLLQTIHGNKIVAAINLDGGRSSNLVLRTPQNPNDIYISNPKHDYHYPVGNILTFTKN